jgi:hypothetical protein
MHNYNSLKFDPEIALDNGSMKNISLVGYCLSRISNSSMNATISFGYIPLTLYMLVKSDEYKNKIM